MKVTKENISEIKFKNDWDKSRLLALLKDLEELNSKSNKPEIYIDYQTFHNEYSSERVDPCPDYYGYYTLRTTDETIGIEMTLDELDRTICTLIEFVEL